MSLLRYLLKLKTLAIIIPRLRWRDQYSFRGFTGILEVP